MLGNHLYSLTDLKQNFCIDELLYSFCCGELEIWLRKIGENDIADKVSDVPHNAQVLTELYRLLGLQSEMTDEEIRNLF